jgi:predicted metalloprotease with PDZ domain
MHDRAACSGRWRWMVAALLLGVFGHAGCTPSTPTPLLVASQPAPAPPAAPDPRSVHAHIDLQAGEGDTADAAIGIELELRGPSAELAELRLTSSTHGALAGLELRDEGGVIPFETSPLGEALEVRLGRAVRGALQARYRIESTVAGFDDAVASTIGPDRFRLSGETAFLLPLAFEQQPLTAKLDFDLSRLPQPSAVASTLGRELSHLRCTGAELRHASFLGGKLNTARFVTNEGTDEWFWIEVLGFDARPVSGEAAALRSELARYFESRAPSPYVVLASASVRLDGNFTAATRSGGLLLDLPVDTSWSGPARIAVCREFFRPWFGGELRLVSDAGEPSPSELWFNEGVARALARELLDRFAMLTPDEYSAEVNGIIASAALSPFAGRPAAEVAERATSDGLARRQLAARGALYATALGVRLRAAGGGSRALDTILAELFARVRATRQPIVLRDWLEAVAQRAGAASEGEYRRIVDAGRLPAFVAAGLGPCFQLGRRRYAAFELGFDAENSRGREVVGLLPRGPAARAGVRATDLLHTIQYVEGDPSIVATLELERDGKRITLGYRPVGRTVDAPAWTRRRDVPDGACQ